MIKDVLMNCGLYIHIPFCEQKCFYCSFVIAVGQEHRMKEYVDSLCVEMLAHRGIKMQTVYIGGGTPGFLASEQLKILFESIRKNFSLDKSVEITLEANPQDLDDQKTQCIFDLGVNRLSIGAQSFHDGRLQYLGRKHSAAMIIDAYHQARKIGFRNINLDLMYGFPHQTMIELEKDVQAITSLEAEHISLYTLTIEPNSRFFTKNLSLPESEIQVEQYVRVKELMNIKGYMQYEVSNFSKKGYESKHNLNYWKGGNYLGIGIAAHSYMNGKRFWNISKLSEYIQRLKQNQSSQEAFQNLSSSERFLDALLFGLRMNEGVNLNELEKKFNSQLDESRKNMLLQMVEHRLIEADDPWLRVTDQGRLVLDEICARLI